MIFDLFKHKHECKHTKVPIDADEAYCPDCGELVKNKWYLVRCSCCNIKRSAHLQYDEFKPDTKFCPNCGSSDFYIQELDKLTFIDVNYAVLRREIVKQGCETINQIWVEDVEENEEKKLIAVHVS